MTTARSGQGNRDLLARAETARKDPGSPDAVVATERRARDAYERAVAQASVLVLVASGAVWAAALALYLDTRTTEE